MTENDIVERGLTAEQYLDDATFQSFWEETRKLISEAILNTEPEKSQERSQLYYTAKGLEQLLGVMQAYVNAKDQVIAKRNAEDTEED
jgi:protoporphyrinogen oxidase